MKNGFSKSDIQRHIDEVRVSVMEQMKKIWITMFGHI